MPRKLDSKSHDQKLLQLYGILMFSRQKHSLSSLAERLKCSKQTVLRCIDALEMSAKGKLERTKSEDGKSYFHMTTLPHKPNVSLTPDDIQHLFMCHDLLSHLLPGGMREEIADIIGHTTVLLDDFDKRDKAFRSFFTAKAAEGHIDYDKHESTLRTLRQGILQSKICNVMYESSVGDEAIHLSIAPLNLFQYKGGFYVKAQKIEWKDEGLIYLSLGRMTGAFSPTTPQEETLTLAIHRILEVCLTSSDFDKDHCPKEPQDDYFGLTLEKPFPVTIIFSPAIAEYIKQRTWSSDQKITQLGNGSVILKMKAGNRDEVFSWLLSFGLQAQILEPKELRQQMRSHATELQRLYQLGMFETKSDEGFLI